MMLKENIPTLLAVAGFLWGAFESFRNFKYKRAEQVLIKKLDSILKLQEKINEIKFYLFKFLKEFVIEAESKLHNLENEKDQLEIEVKQKIELLKKLGSFEVNLERKKSGLDIDNKESINLFDSSNTVKIRELFENLYKDLDNCVEQISLITLNGLINKTKIDESTLYLTQEIAKFQRLIKTNDKINLENEDWEKINDIFNLIVKIEKEIKKEIK